MRRRPKRLRDAASAVTSSSFIKARQLRQCTVIARAAEATPQAPSQRLWLLTKAPSATLREFPSRISHRLGLNALTAGAAGHRSPTKVVASLRFMHAPSMTSAKSNPTSMSVSTNNCLGSRSPINCLVTHLASAMLQSVSVHDCLRLVGRPLDNRTAEAWAGGPFCLPHHLRSHLKFLMRHCTQW